MSETATCAKCMYTARFPYATGEMVRIFFDNHDCDRTKLQQALERVRELAEKYASKAEKDNPQGYGGKPKTLDNSISYWLVSREIWEALNGANGSSNDVQKVVN